MKRKNIVAGAGKRGIVLSLSSSDILATLRRINKKLDVLRTTLACASLDPGFPDAIYTINRHETARRLD